jgi:RNA polymerase sigma factor (sigma-70 family)
MSLPLRKSRGAAARSEHELVTAVRRGDDRAFEELYARYRGLIGSYIYGMVGDHARTEDLAQEVFISALRRLRATDRPIAFKPWLYEIAKNACIDEFRRTRRTHEVPLTAEEDSEAAVRRFPSGATPDAAIESKQRMTDLRGAFRGLSESHHRILVLRELEGLSYNQIGARMGMTKPVVESTLFRARRRLGEEFEELESGRRCQRVQALIADNDARPVHKLGIRERRQFARHLAHCELCLRQARRAGLDESVYRAPNLLGRSFALLPVLSWFGVSRSGGPGLGRAVAATAVVVAGAGASGTLVSAMTGHASRPPDASLAAPLPAIAAPAAIGSPGRLPSGSFHVAATVPSESLARAAGPARPAWSAWPAEHPDARSIVPKLSRAPVETPVPRSKQTGHTSRAAVTGDGVSPSAGSGTNQSVGTPPATSSPSVPQPGSDAGTPSTTDPSTGAAAQIPSSANGAGANGGQPGLGAAPATLGTPPGAVAGPGSGVGASQPGLGQLPPSSPTKPSSSNQQGPSVQR